MHSTTIRHSASTASHAARVNPSLVNFAVLPPEALVDVKTVAALIGCSENTVWRKARTGILPRGIKISEASTRWQVGAIRKYLASLAA